MNRYPSRSSAFLAAMLLTACAASSTGESPTTDPTTSPSTEASASPTASEVQTPVPSPSDATGDAIPHDAIVTARADGLRVRATPGLDGEELGTLASGYESIVVDGPEMADGLEWYLVSGLGLPPASGCATGPESTNPYTCPVWLGWTARADEDGSALLEETEPECADPSGPLDDFAFQPRFLYIACYGDEPLTLRGYNYATPGVADCPGLPQDLWWLGCVGPFLQLVSARDATAGLSMTVGPDDSIPGDAGELLVTGHFDDPASPECANGDEPEMAVLICRSQFVVDSADSVGP